MSLIVYLIILFITGLIVRCAGAAAPCPAATRWGSLRQRRWASRGYPHRRPDRAGDLSPPGRRRHHPLDRLRDGPRVADPPLTRDATPARGAAVLSDAASARSAPAGAGPAGSKRSARTMPPRNATFTRTSTTATTISDPIIPRTICSPPILVWRCRLEGPTTRPQAEQSGHVEDKPHDEPCTRPTHGTVGQTGSV